MEHWRVEIDGNERSSSRETFPIATLATTKPTRASLQGKRILPVRDRRQRTKSCYGQIPVFIVFESNQPSSIEVKNKPKYVTSFSLSTA